MKQMHHKCKVKNNEQQFQHNALEGFISVRWFLCKTSVCVFVHLRLIFKCSHIQLNARNVPGHSSGAVCICVCVCVCLRRDTDYDGVKLGPGGNGSTLGVWVCVCLCVFLMQGLGQLSQPMKSYAAEYADGSMLVKIK